MVEAWSVPERPGRKTEGRRATVPNWPALGCAGPDRTRFVVLNAQMILETWSVPDQSARSRARRRATYPRGLSRESVHFTENPKTTQLDYSAFP